MILALVFSKSFSSRPDGLPRNDAPADSPTLEDETPDPVRLAVLPFETRQLNAGGTETDPAPSPSYLADALADEIILILGSLDTDRLQVIARSSVQRFQQRPVDVDEVRRRLEVTHVLEGSVYIENSGARILVALVDTQTHARLGSATFDGPLSDLLSLRLDVAKQVAETFSVKLGAQQQDELPETAQRAYLEGRYFLSRLSPEGLERALDAFRHVVDLAPTSAHGHAGLAETWSRAAVMDFAQPHDAFARAADHADRALAMDPDSGPAFLAQALTAHLYRWDLDRAAQWYAAARRQNPGSPSVLLFVAAFYADLGDQEEAVALAQKAVDLDPLAAAAHTGLCRRLFVARHPEAAKASCRRAVELDPAFLEAWDNLKWIHIRHGEEDDAVAAFLKVVELEEIHREAVPELRELADRQGLEGLLRLSLAAAEARLRENGQSPFNLSLDHAALNEPDAALTWLQRAFELHETDLVSIRTDPRLDSLRQDPRFLRLVEDVQAFPRTSRSPSMQDPAN